MRAFLDINRRARRPVVQHSSVREGSPTKRHDRGAAVSDKLLLETRPIRHKCDETIRGHVFCSFLALVLRKELQGRLEARGDKLPWSDVIRDLEGLQYAEVEQDGKRFLLRSEAQGTCAKAFAAAGVALPPTVQQMEPS